MSKVLVSSNNMTAIGDTIREFDGTENKYKPSEMPQAIRNICSSQGVLNGIIEEYYASTEKIDANTFVEFVNKQEDKYLTDGYGKTIAVALDSNTVFITHGKTTGSGSYSSKILYVNVCTIDENGITIGTDTAISPACYGSSDSVSVTILDTDKVLLIYERGTASSGTQTEARTVYGIVCTISNGTITVGNPNYIIRNDSHSKTLLVKTINSNKVLLIYNYYTYATISVAYYYGMICNIAGDVISVGTNTLLAKLNNEWNNGLGFEMLSANTAIIFYIASNIVHGMICTISNDTILIADDKEICNCASGYIWETTLLNNNTILILYRNNSLLNGIVCIISDDSTVVGTSIVISSEKVDLYQISLTSDGSDVYITHHDNETDYLCKCLICKVTDTIITIIKDIILSNDKDSGRATSVTFLNNKKIFISHCSTDSVYGFFSVIKNIEFISAEIISSETKIEGLTKSECTPDTTGEVYVLDTN